MKIMRVEEVCEENMKHIPEEFEKQKMELQCENEHLRKELDRAKEQQDIRFRDGMIEGLKYAIRWAGKGK